MMAADSGVRGVRGVIDAHHHLWDPADSPSDYDWLTGDYAPINRPFTPDDLRPQLAASGVTGTVLVQTRSSLDESRALLALGAANDFIRGVVAWVDLTDPAVAERIAELREGPGGELLVGIRHQVHNEPDADWLSRPDVRRSLVAVQDAGLAYDLLVRPRELPAALDACRAMPNLRFVVDHIAKPPIASGELAGWAGLIRGFASLDHVSCKLSGMVTEADLAAWTVADLQPPADHVLQVFGAGRLMFGSDWPVCLVAASYERWLAAANELIGALTTTERALVMRETAIGVYGLHPGAAAA